MPFKRLVHSLNPCTTITHHLRAGVLHAFQKFQGDRRLDYQLRWELHSRPVTDLFLFATRKHSPSIYTIQNSKIVANVIGLILRNASGTGGTWHHVQSSTHTNHCSCITGPLAKRWEIWQHIGNPAQLLKIKLNEPLLVLPGRQGCYSFLNDAYTCTHIIRLLNTHQPSA